MAKELSTRVKLKVWLKERMGSWEANHVSTTANVVNFMLLFNYFHLFTTSVGTINLLTPIEPVIYSSLTLTLNLVT